LSFKFNPFTGTFDIGGGGSQTPWTSNINAANYSLSNLTNLNMVGGGISQNGDYGTENYVMMANGSGSWAWRPAGIYNLDGGMANEVFGGVMVSPLDGGGA
jgi:hypothetical protein